MAAYEKLHPLHIDLVVEQIFGHLKTEDLLKCRRVCSHWNHLAMKPLTSKQNLMVSLPNTNALYSFLNTFLNSSNPEIWSHFELDLESIQPNDSQLLFHIIGSYVQKLGILPGSSISLVRLFTLIKILPDLHTLEVEGLREMIINEPHFNALPFIVSSSVSRYLNHQLSVNRLEEFHEWRSGEPHFKRENLRRLKIVIQIEGRASNLSCAFFREIFKIFPGITNLQISSLDLATIATTIRGAMEALEESTLPKRLTTLRIDDLDEFSLQKLSLLNSNKGMRLKKLQLLSFVNVTSSSLENMLRSQGDSVEELTLGGQYFQAGTQLRLENLNYPFFVMRKLKCLNFTSAIEIARRVNNVQILQWDLDYSCQCPSLKELGLYNFSTHCYDTLFSPRMNYGECLSLEKLIVSGGMEVIREGYLNLLGNLFPNVTDLEVAVRDGACISGVFGIWPRLRKLHLIIVGGIPNCDEWFTGVRIPGESERVFSPDKDVNEYHEVKWESTGRSTLVNLKDLQSLKITVDLRQTMGGIHGRILLSDMTAMLSIRQLSNLRELIINRSDITKNSIQVLRKELNLHTCKVADRTGKLHSLVVQSK